MQIKPPLAGNGRIVIQRSGSKNIVGRFQDAKERGFNGSSAIDGALEGLPHFQVAEDPCVAIQIKDARNAGVFPGDHIQLRVIFYLRIIHRRNGIDHLYLPAIQRAKTYR